MSKVIVFTNSSGGLSVTIPTGELSIEETQAKDTPTGSIIVDADSLPTEYFDACELVDGKVVMNETKKQAIIDAIQAPIDAKASALAKLATLGLTDAEIKALIGA
jgi:hypothetical protein